MRSKITYTLTAVILAFSAGVAAQSFELPMPVIPQDMPREQRPAFVVGHFWDGLDAADTTLTHSREFMEPNAANYFYLLPYASPEAQATALDGFIERLKPDSTALELFLTLTEVYLIEPESPMANDELAYTVIQAFHKADSPTLTDRVEYQRTMLGKNRPGTVPADFQFITPEGAKKNLRSVLPGATAILFFDPECADCLAQIEKLKAEGNPNVIAICIEGSEQKWLQLAKTFPPTWITGYDLTDIVGNDIYYIRTLPTLYHLSPTATIQE